MADFPSGLLGLAGGLAGGADPAEPECLLAGGGPAELGGLGEDLPGPPPIRPFDVSRGILGGCLHLYHGPANLKEELSEIVK